MINAFVIAPVDCAMENQQTINLNELAQISRGERIEVIGGTDDTIALFEHTLRIIAERDNSTRTSERVAAHEARFVPENGDLRQRFPIY